MPYVKFEMPANAAPATAEQVAAYQSGLKASADGAPSARKATTITASTTSQPALGIDGIVVSAREEQTKGGARIIKICAVVTAIDGANDPNVSLPLDTLNSSLGPLIVATKKVPNTTKALIAMPRTIAGPQLAHTRFITVSYFKNDKDGDDVTAANAPPGTQIKLTGVTFDQRLSGDVEAKTKRFDLGRPCHDPTAARTIINGVLNQPATELAIALTLATSAGGLGKICETCPFVATELDNAGAEIRASVAVGLRTLVTGLDGVVAGDGEPYATPALPAEVRAALEQAAVDVEMAPPDAPFTGMFGAPSKPPLLFAAYPPFESGPAFVTDLAAAPNVPVFARPIVTQVEVGSNANSNTGLCNIYVASSIAVSGDRATAALGVGQKVAFNASPEDRMPNFAMKISLRNLAPMLGTRSFVKAQMAARETLHHGSYFASLDVYPRARDDAIFEDKAKGSNFVDFFDFGDLRDTLECVALPVSMEFVREAYARGEGAISKADLRPAEKVADPQWTVDAPALATSRALPISEETTLLNRLETEHPNLTYRVLLDGGVAAIAANPELLTSTEAAEAFLKTKFTGTSAQVETALLGQTILYACAPRVTAATATPVTSAAEDASSDEATPPGAGGKAAKGRKVKGSGPY
jgi:hypothetical protein